MSATEKPHLSPTQLDMYCRCPEQYRRRYMDGEILPPGVALLKGKSFHHGARINMRQKIDSHRDLPSNDIIEAAVESFETACRGEIALSQEEECRGVGVVLSEATDDLGVLMDVHAELQAPDYQPVMVEQKIRIELPDAPRDLLGIIDLADDRDRIVDFKTGARKKSQSDADASVQLTVYAASFQAVTGQKPSEVRLDTAIKNKRTADRQVLSSDRSAADFQALANRLNVVERGIAAGHFPPAVPGAWWCSSKWCGYWNSCPYVNSERKAKQNGD